MEAFVFLFDVDNTLLDNDRAKADLATQVERLVGPERAPAFWAAYEEVRRQYDYVDFVRTLAAFHARFPDEPRFPDLAALVLGFPFEGYVYPGAMETLAHVRRLGITAILSDGDPVYQPAKIGRSRLCEAVEHRVLVYAHKEQHLEEILERFPARRYVLIDDKPTVLAAAKGRLGDCLITIHVRQGHYAGAARQPGATDPDLAFDSIGDLRRLTGRELLAVSHQLSALAGRLSTGSQGRRTKDQGRRTNG